jgi:molybdate transport system substrate-binding protein
MIRSRVSRLACLGVCLAASAPTRAAGPLLVFAASSMSSALDAMQPDLERVARSPVRFSYASSATLARQIEAGAPADLFISADAEWMQYLVNRGLVRAADVVDVASNRLVLVAPAASTLRLTLASGARLRDALGAGRLAVGDPATVPAGKYARAALESLGLWESVRDRLAPGENVRVALQFVARGECSLGIVYASDAKVEPGVRIVDTFPDESVKPGITYPAALVVGRANATAARVLAHLQTKDARRVFARFGFIVAWSSPERP